MIKELEDWKGNDWKDGRKIGGMADGELREISG